LSDFRDDNFLGISTEAGGTFMHLLRTVCQRDGGFEPNFLTVGNSLESLLSMVAAGRGVLLAPQIVFRHPTAGVSFHTLNDATEKFKMFLMRRKIPEPAATVDNFIKILAQSLPRAYRVEIQVDGGKRE
jgi:DNA-binding transcriptional LysR family regulator